ncbi:AT-rich interactive domain-containing protein 2 isoform X2 [Spinacia oleracea]|uniref:AT-rich interactive domain-containing protein 2 isoform X2 n=1 Tax=Spinacia oleracea TaxID=3562 RepID=A0A9R0JS86_SPIOL|nr:AT-rich interactive domain-containing protein 2-like isoform X2 [Spinacia oleracea]
MAGWSIFDHGSEGNCTDNSESNELIDVGLLSKSDDDVKWDDCDDNLRGLFDQVLMVLLRGVYAKNGSRPIPALLGDGRTVDLFKLFCLVRERGGYHSVSEEKLWGLVAEKFGFECTMCASLKMIYYKYLDELDQWLNRITRDRVSANGSYECGGSLGLLSLELEKRLRNFSTDEKAFRMEEGIGYDKLCNNVSLATKETLHLPDTEETTEVHNVVVKFAVDNGERLCNIKEFAAKETEIAIDEDITSRKRKRDMFGETLSWMIELAKNPCHASIGVLPGSSRWKESSHKDFWSIALLVREARLQKKFTDTNDQQSRFLQKHKIHPSMYEDDISFDHLSAEAVRCSKRLSSLEITPLCQCCKSSTSVDKCKLKNPPDPPTENGLQHKQDLENADISDTKGVAVTVAVAVSTVDYPVEKHVLVGPRFQAEVPIWTGVISESDSKWLGTKTWSPELQQLNSIKLLGKGRRSESCNCLLPGSVECNRFHIAENKMKLRRELGLSFYHWKFNRMGEEVSLSWSVGEEKRFKHIIRLNNTFLGKSFFPRKTRMELVSYYYNVFLINRRSYQNRVTPKDIDSDDDEKEFGSVSEAFGYRAVKVRGSEPLKCFQNEQVIDFD